MSSAPDTANGSLASHDRFRITGGARLKGEVSVTGAKNSVLKLMAASLLAQGQTKISNVPDIADVEIMSEL
jgi:UDP-N-acetylglucosamine 1-carboxyvinyltransferase